MRLSLHKTLVFVLVALVAVGLRGYAGKSEDDNHNAVDLVWPPPPEQPRVRYLHSIESGEDIAGRKKLSFFERLAGHSPQRDRMRLQKPYGIAAGLSGRVYIADSGQRSILVLDIDNKKAELWAGNNQFPLSLPVGLAVDNQERLFVTDSFAHRVVIFESTGRPILAFGREDLKRPAGIAVNSVAGRIYVVDAGSHEIVVFDLGTFKVIRKAGGLSSPGGDPELGRFSAPTNIAIDSLGRLFVTDTFNRRVQVLDSDANALYAFGSAGVQPGDFIRPKGIALDTQDHVYVVDAEFNNLQILDEKGQPLLFLGSFGTAPGQFVLPTGMAIDRRNRIFIAEHGANSGRVQVFQFLGEAGEGTSEASQ